MVDNEDFEVRYENAGPGLYEISFGFHYPSDIIAFFENDEGEPSDDIDRDDYEIVSGSTNAWNLNLLIDTSIEWDVLVIQRDIPVTQTGDFKDGVAVPGGTLTRLLDRMVWMIQRAVFSISRNILKAPEDLNMTIPDIDERSSSVAGYDSNGLPRATKGSAVVSPDVALTLPSLSTRAGRIAAYTVTGAPTFVVPNQLVDPSQNTPLSIPTAVARAGRVAAYDQEGLPAVVSGGVLATPEGNGLVELPSEASRQSRVAAYDGGGSPDVVQGAVLVDQNDTAPYLTFPTRDQRRGGILGCADTLGAEIIALDGIAAVPVSPYMTPIVAAQTANEFLNLVPPDPERTKGNLNDNFPIAGRGLSVVPDTGRIITMSQTTCYYSDDEFQSITAIVMPTGQSTFEACATNEDGRTIIVGRPGYAKWSDDLITWGDCIFLDLVTENPVAFPSGTGFVLRAFYSNGLFCMHEAETSAIFVSSDGETFYRYTTTTATPQAALGFSYSPELGYFIVSLSIEEVWRSSGVDGDPVLIQTSIPIARWEWLTWSPDVGLFLAARSSNTPATTVVAPIMYSSDGINWVESPYIPEVYFIHRVEWVAYLGAFVALSQTTQTNAPFLIYSYDAISWDAMDANLERGDSYSHFAISNTLRKLYLLQELTSGNALATRAR